VIFFRAKNAGSLSGKIVHKAYSFIGLKTFGGLAPVQKSRHPKRRFTGLRKQALLFFTQTNLASI